MTMPNPVAEVVERLDVLQEIDAAIEDAQAGQMEHDIIVTLQLAKAEIERLSRERGTVIEECIAVVGKPRTIDAMRGDVAVPDCAQDIIADLRALQGQPRERDTGVPEGFWLAPLEPTHEMIEAGRYEYNFAVDAGAGTQKTQKAYAAMRAAAPQPPTGSTQGWQGRSKSVADLDSSSIFPRDLLPCPFCGEPASLIPSSDHSTAVEVACSNAGCSVAPSVWHESETNAKAIWNQRDVYSHSVATLTRERDQAREALAFYANQDNWNEDGQCFAGRVPVPMWASDDHGDTFIDGHLDLGATARSVLQSEKEEKA